MYYSFRIGVQYTGQYYIMLCNLLDLLISQYLIDDRENDEQNKEGTTKIKECAKVLAHYATQIY